MYQTVRYEKRDNIGIATINRPEALNALNSTVVSDLEQLISEVEKDTELRAFILTGEGRSFVAGADIGEQKPMDVAQGRKWGQRGSAKAIGLVNEVYPLEQLMDAAVAMAKSFAVNAPIAVKYSKACIDRGLQMDIDDGIALENELFAMCFATEDQKEGMGAFLEKRKEKHFQNK